MFVAIFFYFFFFISFRKSLQPLYKYNNRRLRTHQTYPLKLVAQWVTPTRLFLVHFYMLRLHLPLNPDHP
jgi:hypothetical protein